MCSLLRGRGPILEVYQCDSVSYLIPSHLFAAGLTALSMVENVFPDSKCMQHGELDLGTGGF